MRTIGRILVFAASVVAASVIGFGVPLGWIWIGSQLQGDTGATSLNFSVAVAILFGIILTYVAVLYVAGFLMSRFGGATERGGTARQPWMRGMTDTRQRAQGNAIGDIERVFVVTTMIVTAAFWVWFIVAAGSPLPNQ